MDEIYLDNSATTFIRKEVVKEMMPFIKKHYGNPSSLYKIGIFNRKSINKSRERIAKLLNCKAKEIYFTSGGSESNNWAVKSTAFLNKKGHIIVSAIEHESILQSVLFLKGLGFDITYLSVDSNGIIDLDKLKKSIRNDTILVSIMYVNNEIGVIEPIKEVVKICKEKNILVHTDAVQAAPHIKIDIKDLGVDMLSISAHKVYAPKGIGVLYIKEGTKMIPLINGGHQENGMRAGTENIANIVGMAEGLKLCNEEIEESLLNGKKLREYLIEGLNKLNIDYLELCKNCNNKVPDIVNICLKNIDSKTLCILLNEYNIYLSTGSACNSGSVISSHVLNAIKVPKEYLDGSLRISFKYNTSIEEIDYFLERLKYFIKNKYDYICK